MCHPLHFNVPYEFILSLLHSKLLQVQMYSLWKLKQAKFLSKSISLFLSEDHLNSSHVSLEALCCWKIGQKRAGQQLGTTVEINSRPFSGLLGFIIWETYFQPSFKNWLSQSIPRIHLGSHHEKNWETQIEYFIDFVAKHFPFLDHYPFLQVKPTLPSLWGLFRICLCNDGTVQLRSDGFKVLFFCDTLCDWQWYVSIKLSCCFSVCISQNPFGSASVSFPSLKIFPNKFHNLLLSIDLFLDQNPSVQLHEPFWKPTSKFSDK